MRATGWISSEIANFDGTLDDLKNLYQSQTHAHDPKNSFHEALYDKNTEKSLLHYSYLHNAIHKNDIEMTKWLLEQGCLTTKYAHEYAAKNGNLEIIKMLIAHGQRDYGYYATAYSCEHFECFKYYFENYITVRESTRSVSGRSSDLECSQNKTDTEESRAQEFWDQKFPVFQKDQHNLDLDDPLWRKLLKVNLKRFPIIKQKVIEKKLELDQYLRVCNEVLSKYVLKDIAMHCVYTYM